MEALTGIAVIVLIVALLPSAPPRIRRWRGPIWTDAEDAQRSHLDHFIPTEEE